ncbi:hypothetical protein [Nocardiopsis sp. TNDT3]|uniref:hypothetical protein n=1 Tax=Nocardiopsis sp. TNDT3 TaxID=2249354 RepID=UPI0013003728|nr:hypothetical protein [Nocardiopsis sp. TNDT3]
MVQSTLEDAASLRTAAELGADEALGEVPCRRDDRGQGVSVQDGRTDDIGLVHRCVPVIQSPQQVAGTLEEHLIAVLLEEIRETFQPVRLFPIGLVLDEPRRAGRLARGLDRVEAVLDPRLGADTIEECTGRVLSTDVMGQVAVEYPEEFRSGVSDEEGTPSGRNVLVVDDDHQVGVLCLEEGLDAYHLVVFPGPRPTGGAHEVVGGVRAGGREFRQQLLGRDPYHRVVVINGTEGDDRRGRASGLGITVEDGHPFVVEGTGEPSEGAAVDVDVLEEVDLLLGDGRTVPARVRHRRDVEDRVAVVVAAVGVAHASGVDADPTETETLVAVVPALALPVLGTGVDAGLPYVLAGLRVGLFGREVVVTVVRKGVGALGGKGVRLIGTGTCGQGSVLPALGCGRGRGHRERDRRVFGR